MGTDDPTLVESPDPRRSAFAETVVELRGSPPRASGATKALGRYPLLGSLGAGGMGEVLEALDPDLGRRIAAKVMLQSTEGPALRKFVQEAQVTGQLDHPNIVPVHELGLDAHGRVYFTMKKVRGQDLSAVLAEAREQSLQAVRDSGVHRARSSRRQRSVSSGRLEAVREPTGAEPWWRLVPILVKVCDAIEFAHARGVIHRDLKPANIMVGAFGEVQVMDWGLAKVLDAPEADGAADALTLDLGGGSIAELATAGSDGAIKTLDGAVAGTPSYMPPEQADGRIAELDERADIYALGAILYEMLALVPPYTGGNLWNILLQVLEGRREPPSRTAPRHLRERIPWELERVVDRAMAQDKADRYRTVGALREDLERFLTGQAVAAARYTPWQLLKKWGARNRAAVAAAASIAAVVVIATAVAFALVTRQKNRALAARQREAEARQKAEASERAAKASERAAKASERAAKASLADFESMSDVRRVVELKAQYESLGPQRWKVAAIRAWLVEAKRMRARLATHRGIVARLMAKKSRSVTEAWQLGVVNSLVPRIEPLVDGIPEVEGWLRDEPWKKWRRLTITDQAAAWREATVAIRRHPKYGGLRLAPQEGLIPLGPDPKSTLWEFLHLPSGDRPARGSDGRWKITGRTGIVLVLIPGGAFRMGAAPGDTTAQPDEKPAHTVRLAPLFIGKYELTQGQWQRMTGKTPSTYKPPMNIRAQGAITLAHPVEQVSWDEGNATLRRHGLLLPTEAQWEYAARAGTRTIWWTGNERGEVKLAGNVADQALRQAGGSAAFEPYNDGYAVHAPVGRFRPNGFGLHDTIGNVWEWCRDAYDEQAYRRPVDRFGVREHPSALRMEGARARVSRGGGWTSSALNARSSDRNRNAPGNRDNFLGFRPVRIITSN